MASGIQVWNASGNLTLDTTDRVGVVLGTITTTTSNGSVVKSELSRGTPFVFVKNQYHAVDDKTVPTVSVSGTTISWSFPSSYNKVAVTVIYGVF